MSLFRISPTAPALTGQGAVGPQSKTHLAPGSWVLSGPVGWSPPWWCDVAHFPFVHQPELCAIV